MKRGDIAISKVLADFHQGQCSQADAWRALLAYAAWRVQGGWEQPEVVPSADGTRFVIAESGDGEGQVVDGRSLVRELAPRFGGIVFDPDEPWAVLYKPHQLPELQRWASIVELEECLADPAPGQVNLLTHGPWWGVVTPGSQSLAVYRAQHQEGVRAFSLAAVTVFTAPDAVQTFNVTDRHRRLETIPLGPEVWPALAARDDYDGIRVNPCTPRYQLLPPHFPRALLQGQDVRLGADPLPARTIAEIEFWLDLMGARPDQRSPTRRDTPAGPLVEYEAWWGYEPRQLRFTLSEPQADPHSWGESPSQILCAGLLLRFVRGKLAGLPRFRWQATAAQRQRATQALRGLVELHKLTVEGQIPFTALRSPEGAELWHLEPEAFTQAAFQPMWRKAAALAQ